MAGSGGERVERGGELGVEAWLAENSFGAAHLQMLPKQVFLTNVLATLRLQCYDGDIALQSQAIFCHYRSVT